MYQIPQKTSYNDNESKQETMYERIEEELKGVQQALYSSCAVSIAPLSSEGTELGDDPAQLRPIEYVIEAHLHCSGRKEQAIEALKKSKEEAIEKCWVAQQRKI
jgi:hypothetical protein